MRNGVYVGQWRRERAAVVRVVGFAALFGTPTAAPLKAQRAAADPSRFDVLIVNGSVLDGTGRSAQRLDVGIRGDRIVAMAARLSRAR